MSATAASAARAADHPRHPGSVTAGNITRSLLGYLALAGPFYVVVSLVQALTRRMYARRGRRPAAITSRVIGAAFTAAFAGIASGAGNAGVNLAFTAAVIASSAWLTAVAVDLYRRTRHDEPQVAEVAR